MDLQVIGNKTRLGAVK